MKKLLIAVLCLMAVSSFAQFGGLPVADLATASKGQMIVGGGVVLGDDQNLYGGRFTVGLMDGLAIFGDLGLLDPDESQLDTEVCYQGGGKWQIPFKDVPVDLALRGTVSYVSMNQDNVDASMLDFNGGVLGSKQINKPLAVYGYIGLSLNHTKVEADEDLIDPETGIVVGRVSMDDTDNETDLAIAGGVMFSVTDDFSLYGEVAHIDDTFFGLGARFAFK